MQHILETLGRLGSTSGFTTMSIQQLIMIVIACVLLYLGLVKKFEPLLLVGIAFGALLTNLPGSNMYHPEMWDAYIAGEMGVGQIIHDGGLLDILYIGVKSGDVLIVIEAMKMENEVCAPCDGTVKQIAVTKGQMVATGDTLVVI